MTDRATATSTPSQSGASRTTAPRATRLPKARWWDSRLLLGVLLVLGSVVLGTRVVAAADETTPVWAASTDLAEGTVLVADDLEVVRVRLEGSAQRYIGTAGDSPVGRTVTRDVAAGELVPVSAVAQEGGSRLRQVTMPVESHHYPADLGRGDLVDVYVTVDGEQPGEAPQSALVLAAVRVERVEDGGSRLGGLGGVGVTLAVEPSQVQDAVNGVQRGAVDLVLAGGAEPAAEPRTS